MIKALIVEDNDGDFRLFQEIAKETDLDIEIDRAISIVEAGKKLKLSNYDVVFLDLQLTDTDGLDTIASFMQFKKEAGLNGSIKTVVLTSNEDWGLAKQAMKMGCKDYLNKKEMTAEDLKRSANFATYHLELPRRRTAKKH